MSKNALILILLLLGLHQSHAQNFTIQTSDTLIFGQTNENTFYGDIDLHNSNDQNLNMTWENVYQDLPIGWEFSNCDNDACHPIGDLIGHFELDANSDGFINTHFYPNNVEGTGFVEVKIYESGFPDDYFTMTFWGETKTLALNESQAKGFHYYPNPAKDELIISFSNTIEFPAKVQVKDLLGKTVLDYVSYTSINRIDLSRLKSGYYLLIVDENNPVKFLKK